MPVVNSSEIGESEEVQICREVVTSAERAFNAHYREERAPGTRSGLCGIGAFCIKHCSEFMARDTPRDGVKTVVTNVWQMHCVANGKSRDVVEKDIRAIKDDCIYPPELHSSFIHAVALMEVGDKVFLGDLTLCQFVDPLDGTVTAGGRKDSGVYFGDSATASELLNSGFIELTPESLDDFLKVTAGQGSYTGNRGPEDIAGFVRECPPMLEEYEQAELDRVVFKDKL